MKEIPKAYDPKLAEDRLYQLWKDSGYFDPDVCVKKEKAGAGAVPFSVMMPPPNVTGVLHLGHALEQTLLDISARFYRMQGRPTLLLPGTDHAAVATQARVERNLIESGKYKNPREELGREKLLELIREFAEQSKSTIKEQIEKMGTSCDWSRFSYTFDEPRSRAVNEAFRRMYEDQLIYRGFRVINWSVAGQSTCSDDELEYFEEKTTLYTFRYAKDFPIAISTTRPETKLGDTAVAVHPDDERYQQYIGKTFTVDVGAAKPLNIKIIADVGVESTFGTGAVGVTPAHSMTDFEMYERQKAKNDPIELVGVIGEDGKMTPSAGERYEGLTVEEARKKFVSYLRENNLLLEEKEYVHNVSKSDRFKDVVEPLPMTQWFVAVNKEIPGRGKTFKDLMREAATTGHKGDEKKTVKINPERFHKIYLHWIGNLRDWCISRQIWWGHRIPVWYCLPCNDAKGKVSFSALNDEAGRPNYQHVIETNAPVFVDHDAESFFSENKPEACPTCNKNFLVQDEDTLDTWFSSGLWTFSALGWPEKTKEMEMFHPTSWMQMGYEIVFFWMARMILMSTYLLDDIPFYDVYIHGLVRNEQGKKFSKSDKVNADPRDMSEEYGTDALRLSLIQGVSPGNDSRFSLEKIQSGKHMVNKLWNIARFILQKYDAFGADDLKVNLKTLTLADQWILYEYRELVLNTTRLLEQKDFSLAYENLREFTWTKFADWYLETVKVDVPAEAPQGAKAGGGKKNILLHILDGMLKLWHPFAPFVTENIFEFYKISDSQETLLIVSEWPKVPQEFLFISAFHDFSLIQKIVSEIRNVCAQHKARSSDVMVVVVSEKHDEILKQYAHLVMSLSKIRHMGFERDTDQSLIRSTSVDGIELEFFSSVQANGQDVAQGQERIAHELEEVSFFIHHLEQKLDNKEFRKKAPPKIVAVEQEKLEKALIKKSNLLSQLEKMNPPL